MTPSIAYLGPPGTYAEVAALACADWISQTREAQPHLRPYASIAQSLKAVNLKQAEFAVVPVENSIEGGVTTTLDTLWQLDTLQIQQALILPISHALLSHAANLHELKCIYSHPQALAQCQGWIETFVPSAQLIPTNSTTESLQYLETNLAAGAIASRRAAMLYNLPILAHPINDHPDNCTRFWILSLEPSLYGSHTSLAFSFSSNHPGALANVLQIFAQRNINLSRVESRPTKRSLGEYLFFIDIEGDRQDSSVEAALAEVMQQTETLKLFGSYSILPLLPQLEETLPQSTPDP